MGSIFTTQLESLLRTSKSASDPQAKVALSRIHSEIKARLSRGSPAFDYFSDVIRVLTQMTGVAHADIRMECLYHCAQFFYYNDMGSQGLPALHYLESLAERSASAIWCRKANLLLGVIFSDSGDITAAVPRYYKSLDLAVSLKDSLAETAALINLGIAFNYGGLYREAILCFEKAISNASDFTLNDSVKGAAFTNLAQSHFFLGEFEEGFVAIKHSLATAEEPTDSVSASGRTVREYTYVQLALELGKLESARKHASLCKHYGTLSGMLRSQLLAEIALAKCEISGGDVTAGIKALEQTLERCGTITLKENTLEALVKAYDQAGQPEKSLAYLDGLIEHVRATRAKGIAALISAPTFMSGESLFSEDNDLRELRFREAKLRARVAEREVLTTQIEMLERFAVTADLRDEVSGEHGHRVGRLASLMAAQMNWGREAIAAIELGARLHDIGKIGVPDRILLKSNDLASIERHFVSAHTAIGADLLGKSRVPQVRMAEEIARYHHEWWNGEGYPSKLRGNQIPIHARIVAICDVFDALTHGRPYAKPWPADRALKEISLRRATQFDPDLVDVFLLLVAEIRIKNADLDAFLGKGATASPFSHARERIRAMLTAERQPMSQAG
jgi:putative two-component system response regulator